MPFKSEAQRRKFAEMVRQGKMKQSEFDKWNSETPKGPLPERVGSKKSSPESTDDLRGIFKDKFNKVGEE